jgi:hypothetical protein
MSLSTNMTMLRCERKKTNNVHIGEGQMMATLISMCFTMGWEPSLYTGIGQYMIDCDTVVISGTDLASVYHRTVEHYNRVNLEG